MPYRCANATVKTAVSDFPNSPLYQTPPLNFDNCADRALVSSLQAQQISGVPLGQLEVANHMRPGGPVNA